MNDTINRQQNSIHFQRELDATPEQVFEAWTQPAQVTVWWDPSGTPLTDCTIDLRPRGTFRFVTAGHAPPFEGEYDVVDRPRRLTFRAMGAAGEVTFDARGAGTLMNVSIRCPTAEHFETFVKLGVDKGTSVTLDNLVRMLAPRARERASL